VEAGEDAFEDTVIAWVKFSPDPVVEPDEVLNLRTDGLS
jgi:hypothetical protein